MSDPGLPGELAHSDQGTLTGVWREMVRDGESVSNGYLLTIDQRIGTFAVRKDCTQTGGVLAAAGEDRFRLDHYESGYSTEECGPWKRGPDVAPFDGGEVRLVRQGERLFASGGGRTNVLERLRAR